ncbi:protein unc-13 homolog [Rutidosis leptorrhynchoides]|uniref:protein unc-13 homolog n=1 Tax=Rutidosis leptorrhynchoides TaxID=125765 RepID=UPI003A9A31C7
MLPSDVDLCSPFRSVDGLDVDDIRTTAYEIFFTSCRSSPGFGGRNALQFYSSDHHHMNNSGDINGSGSKDHAAGGLMASRVKRALGLRMLKRSPSGASVNLSSSTSSSASPASTPGVGFSTVPGGRSRRPLTSAEIMRQQMKVSEASDNRLRKTLMRTLVGQMGRRAETIILPLELIRHLKPSEFKDANEYHIWQKRQLKILEAGLLLYPSNPLDKDDNFATSLRDIIHKSDLKPIDTGKTSETMRTLCNCVVSLAWRCAEGPTDICHWADGYPLNINLYVSLIRSIFDLNDETSILDEVDELIELMKKTWTSLGINKPMHDLCFTWVLFEQYVKTGQVENDLLSASQTMLTEVANDARKVDREPIYVQLLSSVLTSVTIWCEKRLMDYHQSFNDETIEVMEHILPLVFSATRILEETTVIEKGDIISDSAGNKVDHYTRSSLKNAFAKMVGKGNVISRTMPFQRVCETLIRLANETEELAYKEKRSFSMVLKKWHPISGGIAAVTLHSCYSALLKHFLTCNSDINNEMLTVLQRADKLEKVLINMVVEDSVECEDGGKTVIRQMIPYEVDAIIVKFLSKSVAGRLKRLKDVLHRAKETETWNPKSMTEPYAQSAVELMKLARELMVTFFDIPIAISEDLVYEFADGIEKILEEYTTFVASCGSKHNYTPTLPPLTRCSRGSKFVKLWKMATPCAVAGMSPYHLGLEEQGNNNPRPSTSRGTQRLYIRLNTLQYITSQLNTLEKCLPHSSKIIPSQKNRSVNGNPRRQAHFDQTRSSIVGATKHVSEVAAYRLIFLDSNAVLYGSLYVGHVVNARISPALRVLKQNFTLLSAIVTERDQALAFKEVMKASFEAYLMVLIAGGSGRSFAIADHEMIEDDLKHLKRLFSTNEDGLIEEDVVDKAADTVEGVVALMKKETEQLIEDFTVVVCEASGIELTEGQTLPLPPTTGRWSSSDPNTMLRVLCHRKDRVANQFLKTTFNLAKRA